jgi:hypothetical protein
LCQLPYFVGYWNLTISIDDLFSIPQIYLGSLSTCIYLILFHIL